MQTGFITNCLTGSFGDKVRLAAKLGYQTLEVACWPVGDPKQCDLNADSFDQAQVQATQALLRANHVTISTLAFYENMLARDLKQRSRNWRHLKNVIRLAHQLKVPYVGTYIGKNSTLSLTDNWLMAVDLFKPLVDYAEALDVTILIENCPMPTWDPEGYPGTITYSPELFQQLFATLDSSHLGLNFDPSHLYWQGIDYLQVARTYASKIFSVHVKDVTMIHEHPERYGLYGKHVDKQNPFDFGYYQATLPGYGDIDWQTLRRILPAVPWQVEYKSGNGYGQIATPQRGLALSRQYLAELEELEAKQ